MSIKTVVRLHSVASYFILTFAISWGLGFLVVSSTVLRGQPIPYLDGILMFPAMLIGPSVAGVTLTALVDGGAGLRDLLSRLRKVRVGGRWYVAALLIPPSLILVVLVTLSSLVSAVFAPHILAYGIAFGVIAGLLEEIGWTGYAFPRMVRRYGALGSALIIGALWGLWHAPVVDFLGAAYPHGEYWLPFYLSFIALVMAVRVLIVWVYSNTKSLPLAQITHASSTGFLAFLGPLLVSPAQEAAWYSCYALVLWVVVAIIVSRYGRQLVGSPVFARQHAPEPEKVQFERIPIK